MKNLSEKIRGEIAIQGAITFARFMELALYCPDTGFYEKDDDTVGRQGDFYTSVSVGPVFGELLAFQIAEWMGPAAAGAAKISADPYLLIEAGAHDGRLAKDILTWLRRRRPELFGRLEYWIVEPSPRRRQRQNRTLAGFAPRVHWAGSLAAVGPAAPRSTGVLFANELLDAMPVHRLGWDARRRGWFEWGVACKDARFIWARLPEARSPQWVPPGVPDELLDVLPDGFTTETSPAARKWWGEAAGVLRRGKLLTFDYGLAGEEFLAPQRAHGTLRAYRNHHARDDVLADPGEQDLTAHVNFSLIRTAGETAGWQTEQAVTQAQFLTGIAERFWRAPAQNGGWTARQSREFQTLIHPQHLGRAFRVLLQAR